MTVQTEIVRRTSGLGAGKFFRAFLSGFTAIFQRVGWDGKVVHLTVDETRTLLVQLTSGIKTELTTE